MEPLNLYLRAHDSRPLRPLNCGIRFQDLLFPNVVRGNLCNVRVDKPTGWNRKLMKKSGLKSQDRNQIHGL